MNIQKNNKIIFMSKTGQTILMYINKVMESCNDSINSKKNYTKINMVWGQIDPIMHPRVKGCFVEKKSMYYVMYESKKVCFYILHLLKPNNFKQRNQN